MWVSVQSGADDGRDNPAVKVPCREGYHHTALHCYYLTVGVVSDTVVTPVTVHCTTSSIIRCGRAFLSLPQKRMRILPG
jgi:hypothetical protein